MRRRFFVEAFADGTAQLTGEAAHHLGRVLRAELGQVYELSDGCTVCLAEVVRVDRAAVNFRVIAPVAVREPSLRTTLLLAVVKFDRFEWALEKAVELGMDVLIPLAAERSEKSLIAAAAKRAERWRKIILESAQQARCLRLPDLHRLTRACDVFIPAPYAEKQVLSILLSERTGATPLRQVLSEHAKLETAAGRAGSSAVNVSLAVGPEGGWTDAEFTAALGAGFHEASLGRNILRTETAVTAGLAAAHLYFDL